MALISKFLFRYRISIYSNSYFGIGHFPSCCPVLGFLCLFFCLGPVSHLKGHKLNKPGLRVRECTMVWVNQTHPCCYLIMCPRANEHLKIRSSEPFTENIFYMHHLKCSLSRIWGKYFITTLWRNWGSEGLNNFLSLNSKLVSSRAGAWTQVCQREEPPLLVTQKLSVTEFPALRSTGIRLKQWI